MTDREFHDLLDKCIKDLLPEGAAEDTFPPWVRAGINLIRQSPNYDPVTGMVRLPKPDDGVPQEIPCRCPCGKCGGKVTVYRRAAWPPSEMCVAPPLEEPHMTINILRGVPRCTVCRDVHAHLQGGQR